MSFLRGFVGRGGVFPTGGVARPAAVALPGAVRAVQVLLFVGGVATLLALLGFVSISGLDARTAGQLVWATWPGALALVLSRRLARFSKDGLP